jgi:hypothetical protein
VNQLFQLPNGDHITPADVRDVTALEGVEKTSGYSLSSSPRVLVISVIGDFGRHLEIPCETYIDAKHLRDELAAKINELRRGEASPASKLDVALRMIVQNTIDQINMIRPGVGGDVGDWIEALRNNLKTALGKE